MTEVFAERLEDILHDAYAKLGKKGKPARGKEWTLLAAVFLTRGSATYLLQPMTTITIFIFTLTKEIRAVFLFYFLLFTLICTHENVTAVYFIYNRTSLTRSAQHLKFDSIYH